MSSSPKKAFDVDRIGGLRSLRALIDAVLQAGELALRFQGSARELASQRKPDRSPVTRADTEVEATLRSFFARTFPDAGFLGEESGEAIGQKDLRFIVDPIDGTRAFIRGLTTWSVLVGLEFEEEPVLGIAFFPAAADLFVAVRGQGAWGNGRPLQVSSVASLEDSLVAHGGLAQFTDGGQEQLLERLGRQTYTQRGFADFDGYRNVLLGKADAMIDPGVKPWDLCAAAVLIEEAGGSFTSFSGERTIYAGTGLASNGLIHNELLALVRG